MGKKHSSTKPTSWPVKGYLTRIYEKVGPRLVKESSKGFGKTKEESRDRAEQRERDKSLNK